VSGGIARLDAQMDEALSTVKGAHRQLEASQLKLTAARAAQLVDVKSAEPRVKAAEADLSAAQDALAKAQASCQQRAAAAKNRRAKLQDEHAALQQQRQELQRLADALQQHGQEAHATHGRERLAALAEHKLQVRMALKEAQADVAACLTELDALHGQLPQLLAEHPHLASEAEALG
jgi:chromosome segregation ATPase